jgi:hypothetical protein
MKEDFKIFLTDRDINEEDYKNAPMEAKAKLVEAFENSRPKGKLSLSLILFTFPCLSRFFLFPFFFHAVILF